MIRKYLLPALALAGILFAVRASLQSQGDAPAGPPALPGPPPARASFADRVSGAGMVEAASDNIAVGVPMPGLVLEVLVRPGQSVKRGAPLLKLDDRSAWAAVDAAEAQLLLAKAQLGELEAQPRADHVTQATARLEQARADLASAEAQARRAEDLFRQGVSPDEERVLRVSARNAAAARVAEAESVLAELRAGAWAPSLATARARVATAEAEVRRLRAERDRFTVTSPIDATVLRVDIQAGEYAQAGASAPIVLGDTSTLHVRADVDEQDAHRVRAGAPAIAIPRGDPDRRIPLEFIRVEPLVVPKRNLTGDNTERVDTRVLQVLFRITGADAPHVGQQVDVQIEAPARKL